MALASLTSHLINTSCETRVYQNSGNHALIRLLGKECRTILDIGCGAGDNARLIWEDSGDAHIYGITLSPVEACIAQKFMIKCWTADIEHNLPTDLTNIRFDVLIFSHVLEHLRDPAEVLARYVKLLRTGGEVLIAVPNALSWRIRLQFLMGKFEYESAGTLDETHLRFFTFDTADGYLLRMTPELTVVSKTVEGSVPLWILRRHILPNWITAQIDRLGCKYFPNLFGGQVLIKAVKRK